MSLPGPASIKENPAAVPSAPAKDWSRPISSSVSCDLSPNPSFLLHPAEAAEINDW